jgi:hypothetical protein
MKKNNVKKSIIIKALLIIIFLSLPIKHCVCAESNSAKTLGITQGSMGMIAGPTYPINQDSYFTDDYGNILMFVNVLGMVQRSGQFIVRENADFSTILALTGGIIEGANLRNVLLIRYKPDDNGRSTYLVDLKAFYKKGDRSSFIVLKPNDTIIFPDKAISLAKIAKALSMVSPFVYIYDLMNRN